MTIKTFYIYIAAATYLFVSSGCLKKSFIKETEHPSVIFVLADDLGYSELNCYGNTFNETPNLDKLANAGLRFTNAYASAPVCSPFRASLMTGQHPATLSPLLS